MKKSFNNLKSIRVKLILMFFIMLLVTIIPISVIVNLKVKHRLKEDNISVASEKIMQIDNYLNTYFKSVEENVDYLANNPIVRKADDTITKYKDKTKKSDLIITPSKNGGIEQEIYNVFLQYGISHRDSRYVYMGTKTGGYIQWPEGSVTEKYDPVKRPYYMNGMANRGRAFITSPYYWAPDDQTMISVVRTIDDETGEIIGVFGIDVSLNKITDIFKNIKMGEKGYVMLIDNSGKIIADPKNPENNFKTIDEVEEYNEMSKNNGENIEITVGEEKYITNIYVSPDTGWKYIAMIAKSDFMSSANSIGFIITILAIIFIVLGLIITWLFSNRISKPLEFISNHLKVIAGGNFTESIPNQFLSKTDEMGTLVRAVDTMQRDVKIVIENVKNSSEKLADSSQTLSNISKQSSMTTGEIAQAIEQIASSTNDQARDTEIVADMANNLGEKINESIELITNAYDISKDTNNLSEKGMNIIEALNEKIEGNTEKSSEINDIISSINQFARDAESITNLIEGISSQTNLLALNASIEAARAGESGKGFAVVANEIRKLSEETAKATEDIKQLISDIQLKSDNAVSVMDDINVIVEEQNGSIEDTKNIFKTTIESIGKLVVKIDMVAQHAENMNSSKVEIIDAITNISAVTEESSASSQQISASTQQQLASVEEISSNAENLSFIASELEENVNRFKV